MSHLVPGQPYRVGLLLSHDPGWHTYWKNSTTGYPTSIKFELPEGFTATELNWPVPSLYESQGFTEYVYAGEVLLTVTLTPPADLEPGTVEIPFEAEWLMCENVCIPGGIKSVLSLPVTNEPATPSPHWATRFEEADRSSPAAPGPYELAAWAVPGAVILQVDGPDLPETAYFFDDTLATRPEASLQSVTIADGGLRLRLPLSEHQADMPERLSGVLKPGEGWSASAGQPALTVDLPVGAEPVAPVPAPSGSWAGILALAFIGGMILNLMPCVFPVLGIKIMGFVSQAGESRGKIVAHGLVFTLGVLVSFWALAAVLLILRSSGNQLGWGFQLQSPGFVLALTMLLFAFGLNMSGLFEVGQSAVGVGSNLTAKSGLGGSFFSGVLATVVATPCAAPFLAPALGAALALPPLGSFAVFTTIAIGLSAPYLLLSIFPGLIKWLPRPGPWMETFKQTMGFLLYATVAYLLWVLAGQLTDAGGYGAFSFLKVMLSLVVLAMALWIYGRWGAFHRPRKTKLTAIAVALVLFGAALGTGLSGTAKPEDAHKLSWEEWAPGKAEELAAEGKVVYVDFTARWCVTCQTNKAAVFSSDTVVEQVQALDVVLLKADWTHQDARISEELARYNRSAVPFNLVFGPGQDSPQILPEILTPGSVLEALEGASVQ